MYMKNKGQLEKKSDEVSIVSIQQERRNTIVRNLIVFEEINVLMHIQ